MAALNKPEIILAGRSAVINHPPDRNQSAGKLWCFVAIDGEGNESPCGMLTGQGWVMMMTSKWPEVEKMRPLAREMARGTHLRVVLRQYSDALDLETI